MVGIVIVSHSENLAKSVVELTAIMAADAKIVPAGGMDDGGFGTSYEKIYGAIEEVYSDDGVLVLMDMGSAVMTTEMVIEALEMEGKRQGFHGGLPAGGRGGCGHDRRGSRDGL